jgi:hypothetical protein
MAASVDALASGSTGYPLLDIFLTMVYLFLWILWIFLLIRIISDIFRSRDLSGLGKAGWTIFLIVLPLLGALLYLIVRGGRMHEREVRQADANEQAVRSYIQSAAGTSASTAQELEHLATLRDRGVLTEQEFAAQKARLLS